MVRRAIGRRTRSAFAARLLAYVAITGEGVFRLPLAHASAPAPATAPETPLDRAELEALYTRGEERFHDGDLDGAIESFSEGLSRLVPDGDARLRAYFSVSLAIAHLARHEKAGDDRDLHVAHELLEVTVEHDGDALRGEPRLEALARRNLDRTRAQLEPSREDPADVPPEPNGSAPSEPAPVVPETASPPSAVEPAEVAKRRAAGIGLLVSGTALLAGGIAIVVDGATLERRARAIAEDPPMGRQAEYIENEVPRLQRIRYAIAGPMLAVSVGLLVGGAILLHRSRPPRRVVWSPQVGPRAALLTLEGRF
jgi:hypothetical protein